MSVTDKETVSRRVGSVALSGGAENGLPARVLVVPWGDVTSENGSFVLDEQAAAMTLAAFEQHGTDLPIDYEHQTLGGSFSSPSGQAPAAGWIKRLTAVAPNDNSGAAAGLWADVEWTP